MKLFPHLWKRGIDVDLTCSFCNTHPKSTDHALFTCSRAKNVRAKIVFQVDCTFDFKDRWVINQLVLL